MVLSLFDDVVDFDGGVTFHGSDDVDGGVAFHGGDDFDGGVDDDAGFYGCRLGPVLVFRAQPAL